MIIANCHPNSNAEPITLAVICWLAVNKTGLTLLDAKAATKIAPVTPPTPWTGHTSKASSKCAL